MPTAKIRQIFYGTFSELDLNKYENTWEASINSIKNFIIMPIYPYHPHEDLKDKLDMQEKLVV